MKINDVIAQTRALTRGKYDDAQLIKWLSRLDAKIHNEIITQYVDWDGKEFAPYTDGEQELIIPYVYGEAYDYYLKAKICESNGESNGYNAAVQNFSSAYEDFANWYRRTHVHRKSYIRF